MTTNPFWDYTLQVYPREGVADYLILLQDEADADVNMLLFCLWTATQHIKLSPDCLQRLIDETVDWRHECVIPLRALRRFLKGRVGAESMREQIKTLEVDAEQMQQAMMLKVLADAGSTVADRTIADLATDNLQAYLALLPKAQPVMAENLLARVGD